LIQLFALGFDAGLLFSVVAPSLAVLLGFLFPLSSAVFHCGKLAHDASLRAHPDGPQPWRGQIGPQMSPEHKMIHDVMHQCAEQRADRIRPPSSKGSACRTTGWNPRRLPASTVGFGPM